MGNSFLTTLGLCRKASALLRGRTETFEEAKKGNVKDIFISSDISEKSKKEVLRIKDELGIKVIRLPFTMEELGNSAGVKPMAIFAVTNQGLCQALKNKTAANEEADI